MKSESFTLKLSQIATYQAALKPFDTKRKISAPAKEAVAKTCEALDAAVDAANTAVAAIERPADGEDMTAYNAAVAAVWATKYTVNAWRITKAQAPLSWTPKDMRGLWFMLSDWSA